MELQLPTPATLARSGEDEECHQLDGPVDDEARGLNLSVAQPRDISQERMSRDRQQSISGNLDLADDDSQIISSEEISLEPCTVSEENPLEQASFPVAIGKRLIKFSGIPDFRTR